MATIDIREDKSEIDAIIFSEEETRDGICVAYIMDKELGRLNIRDANEHVILTSKEHVLNLIKALNKAIELGWLK